MRKKANKLSKERQKELTSFEPVRPIKGMMTQKDKDGLLVFLYNWINISGLQQDNFTKEVVDKLKATFNCDLDDYIRTVQEFEARGYIDYIEEDEGQMYVTEPGWRRVKELVDLYGDIPITFKKI